MSNLKKSIKVNRDAAIGEFLKRNLKVFVEEFWEEINNQPLDWNWHLDILCDKYTEIVKRVHQKLPKTADHIFNVPPGTSKTKVMSVLATCWDFANNPAVKEFVGSYSDSAVVSMAYDIRTVMRCEKYKKYFPDVKVVKDFDRIHEFRTAAGGHFFAFTIGGTLTSKHADILKIDDPLNPNEIASAAEIKSTNRFFDTTLPTRKTNKEVTPTILIMQRLSEKDPTGHLLSKKNKKINHICLPGELSDAVKPIELQKYYINGLLDPKRLSMNVLQDLRTDLGSAGYSAQIGQEPVPEKGNIWQRWFIPIEDSLWPVQPLRNYGRDWDTAQTDKEENAACAYVGAGKIGNDIYIDDLDFKWVEFPELIKWMKSLPGMHYIENKSNGKDVKNTLTKEGCNAALINVPGKDKEARARMAVIPVEAGRVYVKKSLLDKLYNDPQQGILKFPNNKHKDLADALSQSILRLEKGKSTIAIAGTSADDILLNSLNFDIS